MSTAIAKNWKPKTFKKISDIQVHKSVQRRIRLNDGTREKRTLDFLVFYKDLLNKNIYSFERLAAKIIDVLICLLLLYPIWNYVMGFYLFLLGILLCTLLNSVTEFYTRRTIGKFFLGILVIDDWGKSPRFIKSVKRNFLAILNLIPNPRSFSIYKNTSQTFGFQFDMRLNNRLCQTYIVTKKQYNEIKILQFKDDSEDWDLY